jgi:hypothetical protein
MVYPDAGFRLLSLFRFWSSVEYLFPEKYLTDKPWDEVLHEYIATFISAKNELEYKIAMLRLIGEVCDSHAALRGGSDKIDSLRSYYPALNDVARLCYISGNLLRSQNQKISIKCMSDGEEKLQDITLYPMDRAQYCKEQRDKKSYEFLTDDIGYITLATIKDADICEIKKYSKTPKE